MSTDLTKMVEEWKKISYFPKADLAEILETVAAEIEANRENLGLVAKALRSLVLTCETLDERIDILKDRIEKLEQPRP